jgi:hypothetical protein
MKSEQIIEETEFGLLAETPSGNWPTPTVSDIYTGNLKSTQQKTGSMHSVTLPQAVQMWPTPRSCSAMAATITPESAWNKKRSPNLETIIGQRMFPTPTANEDACGKPTGKMQKMLGNHPEVRGDGTGGTLNPTWVEWLMGWPLEWTDLKPLEMDKSHCVQQQHGTSLKEE